MSHYFSSNFTLGILGGGQLGKILLTETRKFDITSMDVAEAQNYIPGHPAVQTIYGWTSNGQIPYHKIGKRIYFIKSELDEWLSHGQHKSTSDLQKEAEEYVARYRK